MEGQRDGYRTKGEHDNGLRSVQDEKPRTLPRQPERTEPIEGHNKADAEDYPVKVRVASYVNGWLGHAVPRSVEDITSLIIGSWDGRNPDYWRMETSGSAGI